MSKRCADVIRHLGKAIEGELRRVRAEANRPLSLLDVGCWDGEHTETYRKVLGGAARGVEVFADQAGRARGRGIDVASIDLESTAFPWANESVDVVVANQVFEHLKNVWIPMSEIARVIAPGGTLVFSVPNLASLHNRVMLAAGAQPSSIRTFGPHVRGFTYRQARSFVEFGGFFRIVRSRGVGFYPFPAGASELLANLWIGACHTPILVARRVAASGSEPPWRAMAHGLEIGEQTHYGTL